MNVSKNLKVDQNLNVSKNIRCASTIHGLTLHATKNQSYIGYYGDGKNYLRGINRIEGNVETGINISGNVKVGGALDVDHDHNVRGLLLLEVHPQLVVNM